MKKIITVISFILVLSCVEKSDTIHPEEETEGLPPGYILDVCKCHDRPLPGSLKRRTTKCQSGTSQITECSREECKTEACIWYGSRCSYPYWKETCN